MSPKPHHADPEQKFVRRVVSVTTDGVLVHFHLECGHLVSERKIDVAKPTPTQIDCWACREEKS